MNNQTQTQTSTVKPPVHQTKSDFKRSIAKSAEGYPLLGYYIYWSLSSMEVRYADFVRVLGEIGLPTDIASKPRVKTAANRMVNEEVARREKCKKVSKETNDMTIWSIVSHNFDANNDAHALQETKILFFKETETLRVEGYGAAEIMSRFQEIQGSYNQDDFRVVVKQFITQYANCLTVRDSGGVYFIPATKQDELDKLQELFERYNFTLDVIPIIDTQKAKASTWKALVGDVQSSIQELTEDLNNFNPTTKRAERSMDDRVKKYKELRERVEAYEVLLNGTAEDLKAKIDGLSKQLQSKLIES